MDAVERALGSRIESRVLASTPGGPKNHTTIVDLADGRRVAVQAYTDRAAARVRLHAAEQLAEPLGAHGVPVPRVVAADLAAPVPWAAFDALPGEPGYVAAGWDLSSDVFPGLARDMGRLLRGFHALDPADFALPRLWTDADALVDEARGWLAALEPHFLASDAAATRAVVDAVPLLLGDRPAVVCHGDFAPQNVLVLDGRISGLLDLEDARIGDPLLDVAWWAWALRFHTPAAFVRSWPGFLDAAGIDRREDRFDERLLTLIVLLLLETAERFRRSAPEKHAGWAVRISEVLLWRGQPITVTRIEAEKPSSGSN